ncbi:YicC/YloC family endoribonuclease [Caulobacter sp. 17J80-11]|uniref:YicC/YloC family endoribonuclease n=1 Tax=Caulobacter sp. 17J80-11 TaxID=2763502 RepID=UPI0016536836|nr:YicC/YloC family endoribonuclease [Caulobacter sp. 17J80-11]MBC6983019.1 YicC family protein [Caulobacter sp. 17J80-11]
MSLSGMTGFARVEGASGAWTWAVEARSVNGRNLETRFRGPPGFEGLDRVAREASQARFQRGQVTVGVQAKRTEATVAVRVNQDVLARYVELASEQVARGVALAPTADGLLALRGVLEAAEEDEDVEARAAVEAAMAETLLAAMDGLKAARLQEGAALHPVLTGQIDRIAELVDLAEGEAAAQTAAIRERFQRRMAELVGDSAQLEERIVQEAAVLAVKADVREELDRLKSHVASARDLIAAPAAAGRRLDFLAQEFMREANTLCSKSATTALTAVGLELKAVIEQLREQIQNVE